MTAPTTSDTDANWHLNQLERGATYRATTRYRSAIGEYLGLETLYGHRAILLRHRTGTESIELRDITSLRLAPALT
jgi:hypothetical protein